MKIAAVQGRQILDSRGNPTVEVDVTLVNGVVGRMAVPSGASTGRFEAVELRDHTAEYGGRGVRQAVAHVNNELRLAMIGHEVQRQAELDAVMCELDGTANKSRLGANAILGVSGAVAAAAALVEGLPLYQYLASLYQPTIRDQATLPMPMVNMISGGLHAGGQVDVQDYLFVPIGSETYSQAMIQVAAVRRALAQVLSERGYSSSLVADEGGFGPPLSSSAAGLELVTRAIESAGLEPGVDGAVAIDVAASHFYRQNRYHWSQERLDLDGAAMVERLSEWASRFPLISIEDGLAEDDWPGWQLLTRTLGSRLQILGDDLFVTSAGRIERGIADAAANAVLIKMNQVGTISETLEAVRVARAAGFATVVSARSGETEDSFMADLSVAVGPGQIKVGAVARSERLAKYNRLFRIEEELQTAPLAQPFSV